MSKRILIAGCGYLGQELARQLLEAGHNPVGVTHSKASAGELGKEVPYPVHAADLSSETEIHCLATEVGEVDAVVHCASSGRGGAEQYEQVYFQGCRNLLAAFPSATLLFTSSTSVYPQTHGEWVDETAPAKPDRETGQVLRRTEDLVVKAEGIVARLAGLYGPDRSVILKKFLDGSATIDEGESRFLNQIHRDDAASALVHLLEKATEAKGQIFNVSDGGPMTQRECYERLAQRFQRSLPPEAPRDLNRKRGWTHKRVGIDRLRALGWNPRYEAFLAALEKDERLIPSIQSQVDSPS